MIAQLRDDGGEAVHMITEAWELVMHPQRGARVVSLIDDEGTEWLSRSDRCWPSPPPSLWIDGDTRGWDECFPNIAPGHHPQNGAPLADHGELWASHPQWETEFQHGIRVVWAVPSISAEIAREITESHGALRVRYTVDSKIDIEAAWSMHVLLDVLPQDVLLPGGVLVRVDSVQGCNLTAGEWMTWDQVRRQLPLGETGWACKIATAPGSVTRVGARKRGRVLDIAFGDIPGPASFGLWLNAGGLSEAPELHHVGVEPAFGDCDDLTACIADRSALHLPVGSTTWSVILRSNVIHGRQVDYPSDIAFRNDRYQYMEGPTVDRMRWGLNVPEQTSPTITGDYGVLGAKAAGIDILRGHDE